MRGSRGPHHAVATCNDCHIPHTFPDKYVVKALNGFNHSAAFTLQNFHEPIQITPFNKTVALNNCQYCHGDFVSRSTMRGRPSWKIARAATPPSATMRSAWASRDAHLGG